MLGDGIHVPAKELIRLWESKKAELTTRESIRNTAVTLQFERGLSFLIKRHLLELPLRITANKNSIYWLATGNALITDECVLEFNLGHMEPTYVSTDDLPLVDNASHILHEVQDLTHIQVRVAPPGKKILGKPHLVGAKK